MSKLTGTKLSENDKLKLTIKAFEFYYPRYKKWSYPSFNYDKLPCGHTGLVEAPICKNCADKWINKYLNSDVEDDSKNSAYKEAVEEAAALTKEELIEKLSRNVLSIPLIKQEK